MESGFKNVLKKTAVGAGTVALTPAMFALQQMQGFNTVIGGTINQLKPQNIARSIASEAGLYDFIPALDAARDLLSPNKNQGPGAKASLDDLKKELVNMSSHISTLIDAARAQVDILKSLVTISDKNLNVNEKIANDNTKSANDNSKKMAVGETIMRDTYKIIQEQKVEEDQKQETSGEVAFSTKEDKLEAESNVIKFSKADNDNTRVDNESQEKPRNESIVDDILMAMGIKGMGSILAEKLTRWFAPIGVALATIGANLNKIIPAFIKGAGVLSIAYTAYELLSMDTEEFYKFMADNKKRYQELNKWLEETWFGDIHKAMQDAGKNITNALNNAFNAFIAGFEKFGEKTTINAPKTTIDEGTYYRSKKIQEELDAGGGEIRRGTGLSMLPAPDVKPMETSVYSPVKTGRQFLIWDPAIPEEGMVEGERHNTKVELIESGKTASKVKIIEGPDAGQEAIIGNRMIKPIENHNINTINENDNSVINNNKSPIIYQDNRKINSENVTQIDKSSGGMLSTSPSSGFMSDFVLVP